MSLYDDYLVTSNNMTNDNRYNAQKASKTYGIKAVLKPLLRMLLGKKKSQRSSHFCPECEDNSANEELETNLFEELNDCHPNSAIFVCDDEGQWNISPVARGQTFVPVNFARTEAGTFFWTSTIKPEDTKACYQDVDRLPIIFHDRWVQA